MGFWHAVMLGDFHDAALSSLERISPFPRGIVDPCCGWPRVVVGGSPRSLARVALASSLGLTFVDSGLRHAPHLCLRLSKLRFGLR